MTDLQVLQQDLAEFEDGLAFCNQSLALDPTDEDVLEMREDLRNVIATLKAQIAALEQPNGSWPCCAHRRGRGRGQD